MSKKIKKKGATTAGKVKKSAKKAESISSFSSKNFFNPEPMKKAYHFSPKQKIIEIKPQETKHTQESNKVEHTLHADTHNSKRKSFWDSIFGSKKAIAKEEKIDVEKKHLPKIEPKKASKVNEKAPITKKKEKKNLLEVFNKIFEVLNIFKKKKVTDTYLLPEKSTITTIYDSIYEELKQKKIVKVSYLQKKFDMKREQIIELAMNFEETGKIEIIYPLIGSPRLALIDKGELADEID